MHVLAFTGMPGSGKSEAMEVISQLGVPVFRMGDCIWEEVEARGLAKTPEHVGRIANEMRKTRGPTIWAERTAAKVRAADPEGLVVIDGTRSPDEVEYFRSTFGPALTLVAIHTDPSTRWERIVRRSRVDDSPSRDKFTERDSRELGWGLGQVIALAQEVIINQGRLEEFRAEVRAFIRRWMAEPRGERPPASPTPPAPPP